MTNGVSVRLAVGSLLLVSVAGSPTFAAEFTGAPLFPEVNQYSTLINGDPTDIYYPVVSDPDTSTPIILMLQGALVDQADYSNYAQAVSSYGFTVAVPNNLRSLSAPGAPPFEGLFAEQDQVNQILEFAKSENADPGSPITGLLDTDSLGLVGHSFGGAVGLASIQNNCFVVLCADSYSFPPELKAGIFYGANFDPTNTDVIPPIDNQIPTGLILGTLDGVAAPAETVATFEQLQNSPKVLVEVEGANHYGITNSDSPRDPVRATLDQAIATETIGRWSGAFLRAHISDDVNAWDYIYSGIGDDRDTAVTVTAKPVAVPESSGVLGLLMMALSGILLRYRALRS